MFCHLVRSWEVGYTKQLTAPLCTIAHSHFLQNVLELNIFLIVICSCSSVYSYHLNLRLTVSFCGQTDLMFFFFFFFLSVMNLLLLIILHPHILRNGITHLTPFKSYPFIFILHLPDKLMIAIYIPINLITVA